MLGTWPLRNKASAASMPSLRSGPVIPKPNWVTSKEQSLIFHGVYVTLTSAVKSLNTLDTKHPA